jgi:flagellar biogenesis protein FliO
MRNCLMVGVASILLMCSFAAAAYAQNNTGSAVVAASAPATQAAQGGDTPSSMDFALLRTVGALGLVVSLIVIGFLTARKFMPHLFSRSTGGQRMKLVETLPMGDKRSIALVQVDDSWFLVGNAEKQISLLARLPWEFSLSSEHEASKQAPAASTEKDRLRKLYQFEKKPLSAGTPKPIPADVRAKMRQLREALEQ